MRPSLRLPPALMVFDPALVASSEVVAVAEGDARLIEAPSATARSVAARVAGKRLERVCRYLLRPPFAHDAVEALADGRGCGRSGP